MLKGALLLRLLLESPVSGAQALKHLSALTNAQALKTSAQGL